MLPLSHPLSQLAITWSGAKKEPHVPLSEQWCETRDILRARIDSVTIQLLRSGIPEERARLLDAVLSEIGGNSFDHNIGQWRDTPGVFFAVQKTENGILCVLADRGQGVLSTLSRVRPELKDAEEALRVAFTERISGRSPEQRGNGLKFVRSVLLQDGIDMWYASGSAAYTVQDRVESRMPADASVEGCCAILLLKIV